MANGWDGADPTLQDDGPTTDYELATRYTANAGITITGVRIWSGNSVNLAGRDARFWSTGGAELAVIDIDDTLPFPGWTTYNLGSPIELDIGESIDVSYSTLRYYGAVSGGYPNLSADGNVSAIRGAFITTPEQFPDNVTASFYGVDIVYDLSGANQAPEITGVTIQRADLSIIATATLTDEIPATVALSWDWGDGTTTNTGAGVLTSNHTYSTTGLYAVMVTATDAGGLTDTFAAAVQITVSAVVTDNEEWLQDVLDAVVSDVQRSGYFDRVNTHEPKSAPRTRMTAAIWYQAMEPIPLASGLASTSARVVFILRMYQNWLMEPQDMIDPKMHQAASNLMRRYHDDFDFGGLIRNIDLLGAFGVALSAQSGFLDIDGTMHRVIDITIPCIINDVWPQVS